MKSFFTPGKVSRGTDQALSPLTDGERHGAYSESFPQPKSANVLGAVNKPLSSAGKQLQSKASRMETTSNDDSSSNPGSPQRSKTRYPPPTPAEVVGDADGQMINCKCFLCFRHDSAEMDHSENEDITLKRADSTDKVTVQG